MIAELSGGETRLKFFKPFTWKAVEQVDRADFTLFDECEFGDDKCISSRFKMRLEIVFWGDKDKMVTVDNKPIQQLFKSLKDNHAITKPGFTNSGNIYDPLFRYQYCCKR